MINFKDNFWIYHRNAVEDQEEERLQPATKAWLIVKYINNTGNFQNKVFIIKVLTNLNQGYRLKIGDTVKFGRVRFKIIMLHNEVDGEQQFVFKRNMNKKNKTKANAADDESQDLTESDNHMNFDDGFPGAENPGLPAGGQGSF